VTIQRTLTKLLVVLLLLQWGTAFAHCLALGQRGAGQADGLTVEICTADGIHRVVMPLQPAGEQNSDGDDHDGHGTALLCPACRGPADFALTPPPVVLAAPILLAQAADPPPAPRIPAPTPQPSPCQPRAPPTS
jgi:hypothetical protein